MDSLRHFIGGRWVGSAGGTTRAVIDPVTERSCGETLIGTAADVDRYRQSGNGRESGLAGLKDFMEIKAIIGG